MRRFQQVDVFTSTPYLGNPVAVVLDADGLSTEEMAAVASWTNLSETTFVLPPTAAGADYRVRIFTPVEELPFAGHPTLGTCHAWLRSGGTPADEERIVQECAAGLVPLRPIGGRLAFAAPALVQEGPVDDATLDEVLAGLGTSREAVVDATWADNGPGWIAVRLTSVDALRALAPATLQRTVGVVALTAGDDHVDLELRAFFPVDGVTREDPVTGSLNASVAQWLLGTGVLAAPYVARQGGALGRAGRIHVSQSDGEIWIAGDTLTLVEGTIDL